MVEVLLNKGKRILKFFEPVIDAVTENTVPAMLTAGIGIILGLIVYISLIIYWIVR